MKKADKNWSSYPQSTSVKDVTTSDSYIITQMCRRVKKMGGFKTAFGLD